MLRSSNQCAKIYCKYIIRDTNSLSRFMYVQCICAHRYSSLTVVLDYCLSSWPSFISSIGCQSTCMPLELPWISACRKHSLNEEGQLLSDVVRPTCNTAVTLRFNGKNKLLLSRKTSSYVFIAHKQSIMTVYHFLFYLKYIYFYLYFHLQLTFSFFFFFSVTFLLYFQIYLIIKLCIISLYL